MKHQTQNQNIEEMRGNISLVSGDWPLIHFEIELDILLLTFKAVKALIPICIF